MLIDRFFKVDREFLGCKYPIVCGAMTWISDPNPVCDLGCEFVVFAGGIAKKNEIARVRESGAKVICFAATAPLAHLLIGQAADALIPEGSEAGGHIGPVALSVLIQQILLVSTEFTAYFHNQTIDARYGLTFHDRPSNGRTFLHYQ